MQILPETISTLFNLRRHLCAVHKITMDSVTSELAKCEKAGMAREELAESTDRKGNDMVTSEVT